MMRYLSALVIGLVCTVPAGAQRAPSLTQMVEIHNDLDRACRGGGKDPEQTDQACVTRAKVSKVLKQMGYCMAYPAYTWHRC